MSGVTTTAAVAAAMIVSNKGQEAASAIEAVSPHTMAIVAAATELALGALAEASAATMNPSNAETTAAVAAAAMAATAAANSGVLAAAANPSAMAAALAATSAAAASPPAAMWNGRKRSSSGPAPQGYAEQQYPPRPFHQNQSQHMAPKGRQGGSLTWSLQTLSTEDPDCLFVVRRINKLGFQASRKLKLHFTQYGHVVRILVAHSRAREHSDDQYGRRRPSSLGFVQMRTDDSVKRVLLAGEEHQVEDVVIRVQRFQRQAVADTENEEQEDSAENAKAEENEEAQAMERLENEQNWERQQTSSSGVSTAAASSASSAGTTLPETEE